MTSYSAFLQRLFAIGGTTGDMTLGPCSQLCELLNRPDTHYRIIHVAGTNGKGSVCYKLSQCLQKQGYRVGLFASPHISSYRERVRVNGELINEEEMAKLGTHILDLAEQHSIPTTFFETTMLLALEYYKQKQVDWVVLETGLGGRLDSTNIVTPDICVITSISRDHTQVLGDTIEEITKEKAGIIKEDVPVVIGSSVPEHVVAPIAEQKNAPLVRLQSTTNENSEIAKQTLVQLGIPADAVTLDATPPCRFETLDNGNIILDVAHNPKGLEHLFNQIRSLEKQKPLRILFSFNVRKELDACIEVIKKEGSSFHVIGDDDSRFVPADLLATKLPDCQKHQTITEGVKSARTLAKERQERLVICGSFYIMKDAREALGIDEPRDSFFSNQDWKPH